MTEEREYVAGLVEKLSAISIDLNTVAGELRTVAADLTATFPPVPGE